MRMNLANQMVEIYDQYTALEIACSWYDDPDLTFGGPPTREQLSSVAIRLKAVYEAIAQITGIDPCEQLKETRDRIEKLRAAKLRQRSY